MAGRTSRIERQASQHGSAETGVKLGIGGIRDIEFVVQFHQLLLAGQQPEIRTGNTLEAISFVTCPYCDGRGKVKLG